MSVTSTTLPAALRAILRTANTRCSASIRKNWASSSSGGRCCWMNVSLPDRGWGVLEFSEIRSAAGREWTDDGQVHEVRRPKGGPRNAVRRVPVPPVLVELLREHIQEFGTAPDGRLFRTYRGATYLPSTLWQVLPKARRPYDFRHAGVSWRLNAGTRRRRWPSGPGTPSRCCSGSMRTASTATMSVRPDGRSSWLASALCTGLGSTLGEGC